MAVRENISITDTIAVLNRLVAADPKSITGLINSRVKANEAMAADADLQALGWMGHPDEPPYNVGLLGILNALFGKDANGNGPILVEFEVVCPGGCNLSGETGLAIGQICPICSNRILMPGSVSGFSRLA